MLSILEGDLGKKPGSVDISSPPAGHQNRKIIDQKMRCQQPLIIICLVCFSLSNVWATTTACHPLLWPADSAVINTAFSVSPGTLVKLQRWSEKLVRESPHPVPVLASSGVTNIKDPGLVVSRKAFQDADIAAVMALTYRLTGNVNYLNKVTQILISWADLNQPTGNPIDETRLEGMIWAYDLIACDLSYKDRAQILGWFERLRLKKISWMFGSVTSTNNYRIHQLKMLLMLDKILGREPEWQHDVAAAEKYSTINLNSKTGVSVDYFERSALYYHNFVLQPWLEINLISGCCWQSVKRAFSFLSNKILSNEIDDEFSDSKAKIDTLRANGGFSYAKKGGRFDVIKADATIVEYYTIVRVKPEPRLWSIQQQSKETPWIIFLKARRELWQP